MSLRILHMADVMPSPDSGAAGTDYQGVLALQRAGHQVRAVWADELSHRIPHYNLRYLLELPRSYRDVMLRHLGAQAFDVVQISQPHGYLAAEALAASGREAIFVHRSHGFEPRVRDDLAVWQQRFVQPRALHRRLASTMMSRLLERNNRLIARHADGHLVSASECGAYLNENYGVPWECIGVIPQAVSDSYLQRAAPAGAERMRRLLYVGQYAFFKAPMILGAVVSRLLERDPRLTFTWVCAASHHEQALSHLAPAVRPRVTMLDGMPQHELIDVYDRHGIFLFPSFFEGFGKVFLEAMSRGLVVVAADNGGMKDIISDGVDGYKVPTGDAEAMVRCVEAALADPQASAAVAARAIQTASHFTWDAFARNSTTFYESLIRQKTALGAVQGERR